MRNHDIAERLRTKHNLRITARDIEVLEALASYRFLSTPQLQVLFFPSMSATSARMRKLCAAGLAVKVTMPVRPYDTQALAVYL